MGLGSRVARDTEIPVFKVITWQEESRNARMKTRNNWRRIGVIIAASLGGYTIINQVLTENDFRNAPGKIAIESEVEPRGASGI